MNSTSVIHLADHVAVLDHVHGVGGLALPVSEDVVDPFPSVALSAHELGWQEIAAVLQMMGAELDTEDDGLAIVMGITSGGREVLSLSLPLQTSASMSDLGLAVDAVMAALELST